jgi:hypothetical protein
LDARAVIDTAMSSTRRPAVLGILPTAARMAALLCGLLGAGAIWASAAASAATSVSTNWAGYVALGSASGVSRFTSVSGSWTQPSAKCTSGRAAYSAAWVGLGGYSENATALEQVGTDADCTRAGATSYSAWYELVPAGPVNVALKARPGDRLSASVTVRADHVTLRIRNLTTGKRFTTTKRVSKIDASSADWIVEAPSTCLSATSCSALPLADFDTMLFSAATATAGGHTGTIGDADWTATALELQQDSGASAGSSAALRSSTTRTVTVATPSAVGAADGAFSVAWQEKSVQIERPAVPTLPGFNGGAP